MTGRARGKQAFALLIVLLLGVAAMASYIVNRVGYLQIRRQGVAASVAVAAARGGHTGVVRWLVDRGIDSNASDFEGQTLLSWIVTTGKVEDALGLIGRGADVNRKDRRGGTPLVWAAYRGDPAMISALIRAGAMVDPQGPVTPLGAAIENGSVEIVRLLLAHGADPNRAHRGRTPLRVCAVFGRAEIARILIAAGARPDVAELAIGR